MRSADLPDRREISCEVSMSPVTVAVVGAGSRGGSYAGWALARPSRARVVAVAEPDPVRRERLAAAHGMVETGVFTDWRDLMARDRLADAVVIATPDALHVEPAIAAARLGYHVLLEKPMAPTAEGCARIVDAVRDSGVLFAVCHVLRYTPYTRVVKRVVESGRIGEIMSIQHLEPVGFWHHAHSFVRGNWRRADESSPMLLAKSCHDLDWLKYIVDQPIQRVSSFGRLSHFTARNRPAGAADRCVDCSVKDACPYSAERLYLSLYAQGRRGWPLDVLVHDVTEEDLMEALRTGPYGRCVYACDNDVVDHQVVAMEFAGGVTATFTMTGFTTGGPRRTQIFGTHGELHSDGRTITVHDFLSGRRETIDPRSVPAGLGDATAGGGHSGGDDALMDAFVTAVHTGDARHILSGPEESLRSHLAVFAAERARADGVIAEIGTGG
jgi:predicted dehydrogenase